MNEIEDVLRIIEECYGNTNKLMTVVLSTATVLANDLPERLKT